LAETAAPGEGDRGGVAGLDVGFQSMELKAAEGVAQKELHPFGHVAPAFVRAAPAISEISVLKPAAEDLAQVEDADDGVVFDSTDEKPLIVVPAAAPDVDQESGAGGRRKDPGSVEPAAVADEGQKLVGLAGDRRPQIDLVLNLHLLGQTQQTSVYNCRP